MLPKSIRLMSLAPAGLRYAIAAMVLLAGIGWSVIAPAHAGGVGVQAHGGSSFAAPCPGHQGGLSDESGLSAGPERSPGCAALCSISGDTYLSGMTTLALQIDGVKLALPIPEVQPLCAVTLSTAVRRDNDIGDPPLFLTTRRLLI